MSLQEWKTDERLMLPVTVHTLGCRLNQAESEAVVDAFKSKGFKIISPGEKFFGMGIIIVNSCTVTSQADQKTRRVLRKALRENPGAFVIAAGCYAAMDLEESLSSEEDAYNMRRLFILKRNAAAGNAGAVKSSLLKLPDYLLACGIVSGSINAASLRQTLNNWAAEIGENSPFAFNPKEFSLHSRSYLKIQEGCNSKCSYCRVRIARGESVSLSPQIALERLQSLENSGFSEAMVTGVNITQYRWQEFNLAGLLDYLLKGSSAIALRLASLEPEGITENLVSVFKNPRIRPHFHLSLQSGCGTVLQRMRRAYDAQRAGHCITQLRSAKENPFLACDIIAGFPGETEEEFCQTLTFCEKNNFAWIHAFPFSKRKGTEAYSMKGSVCERETAFRVKRLTEIAMQGRKNYAQYWLGRKLWAVVEKEKLGQCRAVSENYLKLLLNNASHSLSPGSLIRCIPIALCNGANGETADAIAEIV